MTSSALWTGNPERVLRFTNDVGVIEAQQLLTLNINNERVLARQLQATNDRFRVGEITRTDVAQAESSLAGGRSQLLTAEANYTASVATLSLRSGADTLVTGGP